MCQCSEAQCAERQEDLEEERGNPDSMLHLRAEGASETYGEEGGAEKQRKLPEGVEKVSEEEGF
jgi:hypothetical protein